MSLILIVLVMTVGRAQAQPAAGQEYVVQADDSLVRLAEKYYHSQRAVSTIVTATNARAIEDDSFTPLMTPTVVEIGQKLWLPAELILQSRGELRRGSWLSGTPVGSIGKLTIPFERKGDNHIFIEVRLHKAEQPVDVVLDTGSGTTFISPEAARQAGIIPQTSLQEYGVAFIEVQVGEVRFTEVGVLVSDLHTADPTNPLSCELQNGLIGQNLLRHAIWQFDFQQQTLTLTDELETLDHIDNAWRLDLVENAQLVLGPHHYLKVILGDAEMLGMIDTGRPTVEIGQLEFLAGGNPLPHGFEGRFFETTVKQLQVGPLTLTDFPITLVDRLSTRPNWFYLGNTFFENFIVTIDYPAQTLYLQPVPAETARITAPPLITYGFLPFYGGGDQMVVYRVVNPSSAAQAGLQRGDRILRINNDDYTYFSYHQACTLWLSGLDHHYDEPLTVEVERAGQILTIEIDKAPIPY